MWLYSYPEQQESLEECEQKYSKGYQRKDNADGNDPRCSALALLRASCIGHKVQLVVALTVWLVCMMTLYPMEHLESHAAYATYPSYSPLSDEETIIMTLLTSDVLHMHFSEIVGHFVHSHKISVRASTSDFFAPECWHTCHKPRNIIDSNVKCHYLKHMQKYHTIMSPYL